MELKNKLKLIVAFWVLSCSGIFTQAWAGDVVGKITVGYQGWFACPGDGSPINTWWHWTQNWSKPPSPENQGMKSWPEVSGYTTTFETDFANLGNGKPASIFSSYTDQTVNIHFKWMHDVGIDCAALQRFNPNSAEGPTRDDMAEKVKDAAEANGVKFYIMYDVSGWTNMQSEIKTDWTNKMKVYTSSSAYAYEGEKPVVCIWGFGFNDNNHPWDAATCIDVINWFKGQGCYVIGGVPTHWRTQTSDSRPNFISAYHALDMISPWMVGRIGDISGSNNFYTNVNVPDQADCNANGIDYQPCVLPGDMQEGQRANGDFMWRQFYNMVRAGCQAIYISMFDEYNESHQILNTADSYFSIPTNQTFKTTSSGGKYISPDFYMRLTGEGGKMLKGIIPLSSTHTVSLQSAPIWYRSSFESGSDALLSWSNSVESSSNVTNPKCERKNGVTSHLGDASIVFSGTANGGTSTNCYFQAISSNIVVNSNTVLEYWLYPENENSRYVGIDLHCTDGTTLSSVDAVDQNGNSMHPSVGHGEEIPVNAWSVVKSAIGEKLAGKTVDKILIAYDNPGATGAFSGYIDDIKIIDDTLGAVVTSVTGVELTPDSIRGTVGTKFQLYAKVLPANATDIVINYSSSNPEVATVSPKGLVSATSIGDALIIATSGDGSKADTTYCTVISSVSTPLGGTPQELPGTIEMEDFDEGGEGVAYHDLDGANHSDYRISEGVGIESCGDDFTASPGGYNVGYTNTGEWLKYTVNVTKAGKYDAEIRVASDGGSSGSILLEFGGTIKTSFTVPDTKGWQNWQSVVKKGLVLDAGTQVMRINLTASHFNINKIVFTKVTETGASDISAEAAFEIYPNPASSSATISYFNKASEANINIYNLQGRLIKSLKQSSQAGLQNIELDLTEFTPGIYIVGVATNDFTATKKLVVQ